MPPSLAELQAGAETVYRAIPATTRYAWPLLARRSGCEVWGKHENHTPIGAFKVRGELVYMDALKRDRPARFPLCSAGGAAQGPQTLG